MLCRFCSDRDSRVRRAAVDGLFLLCQKAAPLTLTSYSTAVTVRITSPILHILIFRFLVLYYPFYFSKDRFFIYEMWSYSCFWSFQKIIFFREKHLSFYRLFPIDPISVDEGLESRHPTALHSNSPRIRQSNAWPVSSFLYREWPLKRAIYI